MTKLEKLYSSIRNLQELGLPLNSETLQAADELEETLIKTDILPALSENVQPLLQPIQRDLVLVVEYHPGEPISVALSRKVKAAEVLGAKPLKPNKTGKQQSHGTTCPTKYNDTPMEVVFEHVLDYSFYNYGCTIDKKFHQPIFDVLGGRIERGQHKDIMLRYDGKDFAAQIENVDRKGVQSDTIRCMWKGKAASKLSTYLQQQFAGAFAQIKGLHESHVNVLPSNLKRIALFYNQEARVFEMELK